MVKREEQWTQLLSIIQMTKQKEEITKQYKEENNLINRMNIHKYSTSRTNWYQWVLDGLKLRSGMKILEVDCGNGMLWIAMRDQLPENLKIILTNNSQEMLETAKRGLKEYETLFKEKDINIQFVQKDAENFIMGELSTLIHEFDERIKIPSWMSAGFELENDLLVPDPQAIFDYAESLPSNIKEILGDLGKKIITILAIYFYMDG